MGGFGGHPHSASKTKPIQAYALKPGRGPKSLGDAREEGRRPKEGEAPATERAAAALRRAIELNPFDLKSYYHLARLDWAKSDFHAIVVSLDRARAKGLDDVGSILQHVGEQMTTDFPVDAYVGPWDCANFVSDTLVALASGERCECSSAPTAEELEARAAEFGGSS